MDLETIKVVLEGSGEQISEDILTARYEAFAEETGRTNLNEFAIYLHREQLIDTKILSNVLTHSNIEITRFDHLQKQIRQIQEHHVFSFFKQDEPAHSAFSDEETQVYDSNQEQTLIHDSSLDETLHSQTLRQGPPSEDLTLLDHSDQTLIDGVPLESDSAAGSAESQSQNYDILGSVGQGGMGEILLAKDKNLLRTVAYKKLHNRFSHDAMILEQFLNEVQITSQLEHPNVVPIYHLEISTDGKIAYSMKLVQGKTLKELIQEAKDAYRQGSLPDKDHQLPVLLEHFLKVCNALEYAHSKGVLHRDLKPANIMVGAYGEVNVMDWGIACLMGQIQESKQAIGTPRYMSPEQAGGLNHLLDARSDLFSLGLILFEIVTLTQAIPSEKNIMDTLLNTIKGKRNPIVHDRPEVKIPTELKAIIEKATTRKRKDRYDSVQTLAEDVQRYLRGEAILARPDTFVQSIQRFISQNKEKTLMGILALLFVSASLLSGSMVYRHLSLLSAQQHDDQVHQASTLVAVRGNKIDQHFFYLEGLLRAYGTAVQQRLEFGRPVKGTYYTLQDYQNPQTRPVNTRYVDKYKTDLNIDWGMILHAPGSDPELMKTQTQIMHPLQSLMKQTVIDSYHKDQSSALSKSEINRLILERKMPILWIFTALETGYYMVYPSTYNYKEGYDPRQRPWYKMAKSSREFRWQEPYRTTGGEVDLPCLMPLYDKDKNYLGVAVIEMTFDYIQEHFLELKIPGVLESSLVNQKGEIIVSTVDHYASGRQADKQSTKTELVQIASPEVKQALQKKRSGYFIEEKPEGNQIYVYYYISSLDWHYVIRADEAQFLAQVSQF